MVDVVAELGHLKMLAEQDANKRFTRLYRLLRQNGLLAIAKERIGKNRGAQTPGVDGLTMADMENAEIIALSEELRTGTYQPKPARRVYIPKRNGKLRPLGIPMWRSLCTSHSRVGDCGYQVAKGKFLHN
jgi:retron-type reverse transcriptase